MALGNSVRFPLKKKHPVLVTNGYGIREQKKKTVKLNKILGILFLFAFCTFVNYDKGHRQRLVSF